MFALILALLTTFPSDELFTTIKQNSVHRLKVDWKQVEAEYRQQLAQAPTDVQRARAVVAVFAKLGDVHSSLTWQGKYYGHHVPVDEATHQKLKPLMVRQRQEAGKPTTKMLPGNIAFVRVPAYQGSLDKMQKAAVELHDQVGQLIDQKPVGWIVDLRLNGGGNMYPMLLGLQPLLGNEVIGGTIGADMKLMHHWALKSEGLYWRQGTSEHRIIGMGKPARFEAANAPVAVLVGPVTISSGQVTALAFKHRPRAVLLGEPTGKGYTTVNTPITIGSAFLNLSVGYMADRQGNAYKEIVLPDITLEGGDLFDQLMDDRKVQAAIQWLKMQ